MSCTQEESQSIILDKAIEHFKDGEFVEANDYALEALEQGQDSVNAYYIMGISNMNFNLYRDNKEPSYSSAILYLTEAIKIDSTSADLYFQRSLAKLNMNDHRGSIQDLEKTIELTTDTVLKADAYFNMSLSQMSLGRTQLAYNNLNEAINLNPNEGIFYNERGRVYNSKKDTINALNDFNTAINLDKEEGQWLIDRGRLYLDLDSLDNACLDFSKASEISSSSFQAHQLIEEHCN